MDGIVIGMFNRMNFCILVFLFCGCTLAAQNRKSANINPYQAVDMVVKDWGFTVDSIGALSQKINTFFSSDDDKSRAIFYWVTDNIRYDADLMYTYKNNSNRSKACESTFKTRAAVCLGIACLVDSLCRLTGIKSYLVEGSTRQKFLPDVIGHVYNAVKINGEWKLMDATWGAGYLSGKDFIKERHNDFFLADGQYMINTHLPLDPIWQLKKRPLKLEEFYGNNGPSLYNDWNYNDSIDDFLNKPYINQITDEIRRLTLFGAESQVSANHLNYLNYVSESYYTGLIKTSVKLYNSLINDYNDYINFKNQQFTPAKPDSVIKNMLPKILTPLKSIVSTTSKYKPSLSTENQQYVSELLVQIQNNISTVESELLFVNKYLTTPKNKRRDLFFVKMEPSRNK